MDERALGRTLIRIAGLIIVAYALIGLPQNIVLVIGMLSFGGPHGIPTLSAAMETPQFWGMSVAPFLIYLAIGVGLFGWGSRLVDRTVVAAQSGIPALAPLQEVEESAVAVLGLYFFAQGLAAGAHLVALDFVATTRHAAAAEFWPYWFGAAGTVAARLAIGAALVIGAPGLVVLRRRLLTSGLAREGGPTSQ